MAENGHRVGWGRALIGLAAAAILVVSALHLREFFKTLAEEPRETALELVLLKQAKLTELETRLKRHEERDQQPKRQRIDSSVHAINENIEGLRGSVAALCRERSTPTPPDGTAVGEDGENGKDGTDGEDQEGGESGEEPPEPALDDAPPDGPPMDLGGDELPPPPVDVGAWKSYRQTPVERDAWLVQRALWQANDRWHQETSRNQDLLKDQWNGPVAWAFTEAVTLVDDLVGRPNDYQESDDFRTKKERFCRRAAFNSILWNGDDPADVGRNTFIAELLKIEEEERLARSEQEDLQHRIRLARDELERASSAVEASKNHVVVEQLPISMLMILGFGVLLLFGARYIDPKDGECGLASVLIESGQLLQFATVVILFALVMVLSLAGAITDEHTATLLASVGGYLLGKGIGRPVTRMTGTSGTEKKQTTKVAESSAQSAVPADETSPPEPREPDASDLEADPPKQDT